MSRPQRAFARGRTGSQFGKPHGECEEEQGLHRLLESSLDEVGRGEVGGANQERDADAPGPLQVLQEAQRRERRGDDRREHEPAKPVHERDPELRKPRDQSMRAERIALGDQPLLSPVRDPVGREEMLRHVGIERGAQDPEAHLDQERKRPKDDRADRGWQSVVARASRRLEAKEGGADDREDRRCAEPGPGRRSQVRGEPRGRAQESQADGRGERRALAMSAGAEHRLTDDERSPQDECQRNVGAEHRAASLQPYAPGPRRRGQRRYALCALRDENDDDDDQEQGSETDIHLSLLNFVGEFGLGDENDDDDDQEQRSESDVHVTLLPWTGYGSPTTTHRTPSPSAIDWPPGQRRPQSSRS